MKLNNTFKLAKHYGTEKKTTKMKVQVSAWSKGI